VIALKIAVLTHNYPRYSGDFSGRFIEALCEALVDQGQSVRVVAPWDPAYQPAERGRIPLELYRYAPRATWHQLGYMRSMRGDLVMRANSYLLAPGMFIAGILRTAALVRTWRPDVLHAHWLLPNGFIAAVVARHYRIPLVVSIPGSDVTVAVSNPLFRAMARFALGQSGLVTANSEALRDVALSELGADPQRFALIAYGVDPERLRPGTEGVAALRERLGISPQSPVFLAVGRMVYKKGFDVLLRALAELVHGGAEAQLVLVGEGEQWADWKDLGVQLGLSERLHWVGNVPTLQIAAYYNLADVLVMPSITRPADGLNVTVLDAMSCAKPVIGTPAAGNRLAVEDGVNGLIVPEGDPLALAGAMQKLMDNPDLCRAMGQAGRRRVESELGWPSLAATYVRHFERLTQA
jgi:glycosyltransferase involved in cell wall biosynthesis